MGARYNSNPGNRYGYLAAFSKRYLLACVAVDEFNRFIESAPLTISPFNEKALTETAKLQIAEFPRQGGIGQSVLTIIRDEHTNSKTALKAYRKTGHPRLRPFAGAIIRVAFNRQIIHLLEDNELKASAVRAEEKLMRSFNPLKLYKNPLFSPASPNLSFSLKSIGNGIRSGVFEGLGMADLKMDAADVIKSACGFRKGSGVVASKPAPEINPKFTEIIAEYYNVSEHLPVVLTEFNEQEVIDTVMADPTPSFRSPGKVLSVLRHNYSNYDRLYFSEDVRKSRYWMLTGHCATQRAVYQKMIPQARTEVLRAWLEGEIKTLDKRMEVRVNQAVRCRNTEWFIRNSYIESVTKNIQQESKRDLALSYAG